MVGHAKSVRTRKAFSVVNLSQDESMRAESVGNGSSECGGMEFTREVVDALMAEKMKGKNKYDHKGAVMDNNETMVPLVVEPTAKVMIFNETRRRLGSFRICSLCTCCGGPKGLCLPSPCCYAINCNIPNRPFGYCSFTPKTCNCFGCHI